MTTGPVFLATCRNPPVPPADDPLLASALKKAGCDTRIHPWTDIKPSGLPPGSTVILRSTWDYHRQTERFLAWLSALESAAATVLNPPSLVRLTIDKSYLVRERPFGCPAPVTLRMPCDAPLLLREVRGRGWRRFVIKPPVSASAEGTFLLDAEDTDSVASALQNQPPQVLVQNFLPEIRNGELSLIFFERWFSHAVRKFPADGDFRVQSEFGSRTEPFRPAPAVIAAARRTLRHLPEMPCYARVDGLMRKDTFLLMELELIEPELFLSYSPDAAELLADAILRRISPGALLRF